jgi:hypothetical protein
MTWLLPILRHRATWGVGICVGFLVAIAAHGKLKYTEGHRDGTTEAQSVAQADAMVAKAASDSAWSAMYQTAIRSRDAQRIAEKAAARARTRSAVAEARLANALLPFAADTIGPIEPACSELADACRNAAALWSHERDTLTALIAVQDRTILQQTDMIATEPARLSAALRAELARQRETFKGPSRVKWLSVGAVMGFAAAVLR